MKFDDLIEDLKENPETIENLLNYVLNDVDSGRVREVVFDYVNSKFIALKEISEITGKTPQAVFSMIKVNKTFPESYIVNNTNLYNKDEVISWAKDNNKLDPSYELGKNYSREDKLVNVVGEKFSGKTTICIRGARENTLTILNSLVKLLDKSGYDNEMRFSYKNNSGDRVVLYFGDSGKILELELSSIDNVSEELNEFISAVQKCNDIKEIKKFKVEFILNPCKILSTMLKQCGIKTLTFVDGGTISDCDAVIHLLVGNEDDEDLKTSYPNSLYLYNNRFADASEYDESIEECMDIFSSKNLDEDSIVCVPNFPRRSSSRDEFFMSQFCKKLKELFCDGKDQRNKSDVKSDKVMEETNLF